MQLSETAMAAPERRPTHPAPKASIAGREESDPMDTPRRVIRQITSEDATAVCGEIRGLQILTS
jgi:hypothetical protein